MRQWHNRRVAIFEVDDALDPRLADYVSLTDVTLRSRHEPDMGIYIAESAYIIRRALGPDTDRAQFSWIDAGLMK